MKAKIFAMLAAAFACLTLTCCHEDPEPDPTPDPNSNPPAVDNGSRWVLSKVSSDRSDNTTSYAYDEKGRVTECTNSYTLATSQVYTYGEKSILLTTLNSSGSTIKFEVENGRIIYDDFTEYRYIYSNNELKNIGNSNHFRFKDINYDFLWKNGSIDVVKCSTSTYVYTLGFEYSDNPGINSSCIKAINAKILEYCLVDVPNRLYLNYPLLVGNYFGKLPDKLISEISWNTTPEFPMAGHLPHLVSVSEIDSNGCPKVLTIQEVFVGDTDKFHPSEIVSYTRYELEWKKL